MIQKTQNSFLKKLPEEIKCLVNLAGPWPSGPELCVPPPIQSIIHIKKKKLLNNKGFL